MPKPTRAQGIQSPRNEQYETSIACLDRYVAAFYRKLYFYVLSPNSLALYKERGTTPHVTGSTFSGVGGGTNFLAAEGELQEYILI